MADFLNVCRFNPSAGGTSDWTYVSPVTGYQAPALAGATNGRLYKYRAESADLTQWENGEGVYNSSTGVLTRTTILFNSSGTGTGLGQTGAGSKINFTTIPQVAIVAMNEDLAHLIPNSFTPEQYGAKGDTRIIQGAVITASGTALAATAAVFQQSDVGKYVTIGGCGYQVALDATVANAGTGYTTYDQLTVAGGTGIETALIVVNATAGAVSSFNQYYRLGKYSVLPSNPVSTTGGTGTGATFNLTYRSLSHTAQITAVAGNNLSVTLANGVIFPVTSSTQTLYIGTDDGLAMQNCFTAAVASAATLPTSILLSGNYTIYDRQLSLAATSASLPISLVGYSESRLHFAQQTGNKWGLYLAGPGDTVLAGSGAITAPVVEGSRLATVSSAITAGSKVGSYLYINSQTSNASPRGFVARISNIFSSTSIELDTPFPFSVDYTQPNFINLIKPAENLLLSDIIFDGFGTITDLCVGLAPYQVANSTFRNIACNNFWSFNSSGITTYEVAYCTFDISGRFSGGGTGADAFEFGSTSSSNIKVSMYQSYGFGVGLTLSSKNEVDLRASKSYGRMVKLYGSCGNTGDVEVGECYSGFVGLAFTYASSGNLFRTVRASNCYQGIWSDGTGNTLNTVSAYYYANNTYDIALTANDSKFDIYACLCPSALVSADGSTGSLIRGAGAASTVVDSTVLIASAVALTNTVSANVTSITLQPGEWDVWGSIGTNLIGGATLTVVFGAISIVSATLPTIPNGGAYVVLRGSWTSNLVAPVGMTRLSLTAVTTVYLVTNQAFSGGTSNSAYGYLGARRKSG